MHVAGRKKTHKGGHRHFTSEDDLARQQEKARKEREWRVISWCLSVDLLFLALSFVVMSILYCFMALDVDIERSYAH